MIEKIKEFFSKKPVKVTEFVMLIASAAGLIFGGVTTADISKAVTLTEGVIVAVEDLQHLFQV